MKKSKKSKAESYSVAAIDIGTNSTRYMVLSQNRLGNVQVLEQGGEITRLGQDLHHTGKLQKQSLERTLKVIKQFLKKIQKREVQTIELFATSALRDASNGKLFTRKIEKETLHSVRILSGKEEAQRAYHGMTTCLPKIKTPLTLDIGGGSTEIVFSNKKEKLQKISLKIGAVRLTEAMKQNREKALVVCKKKIQNKLSFKKLQNQTWIGAGGTITSLAAMAQKLKKYEHKKIHGYRLTRTQIEKLLDSLEKQSLTQLKKTPGLEPKRADIIVGGITILVTLLQLAKIKQIVVSDRGILYGTCLKLLEKSNREFK